MKPLKSFDDRTADFLRAVLLCIAALMVLKFIPTGLHTWNLEYERRTPPGYVVPLTWAIGVAYAALLVAGAFFSVRQRPVSGYAYPARKLNILQELIIAGGGAGMLIGAGFALFSLPMAAEPAMKYRHETMGMLIFAAIALPAGFACLCLRPVYVVDPVAKTLTHYRIARFLGVTRLLPFEFTIRAIQYRRQYGYVWAIMHQDKKREFLVDFLDYRSNSKQAVDDYAANVNHALHGAPIAPAPVAEAAPAMAAAPNQITYAQSFATPAAAPLSPYAPSHYPR